MKIETRTNFELTPSHNEALVLLYQAVFAFPALSLYLTLYELGKDAQILEIESLIRLMNVSLDDFKNCRQELERFGLLQTYQSEDKVQLILEKPLTPESFIKHTLYGRLYAVMCGNSLYKEMSLKYISEPKLIEGNNISKPFDSTRLAIWNESFEASFNHVERKRSDTVFDVERFFMSINPVLFPYEMRSEHVRQLVEEVGTLYQMSHEQMRSVLYDASNLTTMKFDAKRFVLEIEKTYGKMKVDPNNPYMVDPVSFLRFKQGYEYVAETDRNLVKSLNYNFGFSNEVINVLIEHVLTNNNMNLARGYVEKVAAQWKRQGVENLEDALKIKDRVFERSERKKQTVKNVQKMPIYSTDTGNEAEAEALRKELAELWDKGDA